MTELSSPEVIKTENTTPQEQSQAQPQIQTVIATSDNPEESPQDRDWRKWRENRQKEREEAAKIDAARRKAEEEAEVLRKALEAVVNKPTKSHSHEALDDDISESEEARIDRRIAEALQKQQENYRRQEEERESREYPAKLRSTFKDFEQVCTAENLDYLEFHHPELAKSLSRVPQSFDKWADVYSAIKRYVPNPNSSSDVKRADRNLQKPQSLSHTSLSDPGTSPMGARRLDEKTKAANWERMQRTLKGLQ